MSLASQAMAALVVAQHIEAATPVGVAPSPLAQFFRREAAETLMFLESDSEIL